ncbi:hypothetical protein, partial [Pseudomonas syringae group genomosp. 3]|uniref:hypothetical protein n=1 Tax=Pseudomonas syringae group genomosp. 3 TaxID=251701 RepID=UPI001C7E56DE
GACGTIFSNYRANAPRNSVEFISLPRVIIAPTLRVVALFWTLCVLLTTQGVENCIPTLEWRNDIFQLSCQRAAQFGRIHMSAHGHI